MAAIGAMSVEIGREMAGQDPEYPDPYRDVEYTIVVFVFLTLDDFFHEW
jgi:hypothetical protein